MELCFLKAVVSRLCKEQKERLCRLLQCEKLIEPTATKSFREDILAKISGVKTEKCQRSERTGFFGYHCGSPDILVRYKGQSILIECKILRPGKEFEIRNSFGQIIEYSLNFDCQEACILIFDVREKCFDLFSKDSQGLLNKWFVDKFGINNLPERRKDEIKLSIVRIFPHKKKYVDMECYVI